MRIVAGEYRSRKIEAVDGDSTRPTSDKVKEAIYSRIGPYFDGGNMLDLFGGSGNISLEAISRGMEHALLCDSNAVAFKTIKKNIQTLGVENKCAVWKMDYHQALDKIKEERQMFDFVYLDPPYKKQQIVSIVSFLEKHHALHEQADVVCESLKEDMFPDEIGSLIKEKDVTYGITRITYYKKR